MYTFIAYRGEHTFNFSGPSFGTAPNIINITNHETREGVDPGNTILRLDGEKPFDKIEVYNMQNRLVRTLTPAPVFTPPAPPSRQVGRAKKRAEAAVNVVPIKAPTKPKK
jgi:hypothetical protein